RWHPRHERPYTLHDLGCSISLVCHLGHATLYFFHVRRLAIQPAQTCITVGNDGAKGLSHFVRD
ncbi:MAG TPA: hypothetical protein VGP09_03680, partial [Caballeronia sp.]|nr:hypothetical protein [Caballeronia sp.]